MSKAKTAPAKLFAGLVVSTVLTVATLMPAAVGVSRKVEAQANQPPNPVIFLHYDYMVKAGSNAHSHAPNPQAIQMVVEAFRRHGITLHIDPQHTEIPERQVTTIQPVNPACAGPDAVDIHELRATYFSRTEITSGTTQYSAIA